MENSKCILRRLIKPAGLALLLLAFAHSAKAGTGPTLPLDSILSRIERENPLLQVHQLRAEGQRQRAAAKTYWSAPMIGGGTYMTPYPPAGGGASPAEKGSWMLQWEQALPARARQKAEKAFTESLADIQETDRAIALNEVLYQAKRLYVDGVISLQRIELYRESQKVQRMVKEMEELRYSFNRGELAVIYQLQAQLAAGQDQIENEQAGLMRIKSILAAMMNQPSQTDFALDRSYTPEGSLLASSSDQQALFRRADWKKLDQQLHSSGLELKALELENRPELSIRLDHMSPVVKGGMPASFSLMGMVSIPFAPWSAKRIKQERKALEYDMQAIEKEKQALAQQTRGVLNGLKLELNNQQRRVAALSETIIPALQQSFDAYFSSYQENEEELSKVLQAWDALIEAKERALEEKLTLYELLIDYEKETYL